MMGLEPPGDRIRLRVRYAETDQMGRAHHMQYLAWFELGRTELIRGTGLSYAAIERTGTLLPVAEVEVRYGRAVGYDELVEIETRITEVRSRTVTFAYRAFRADDGEPLASGRTRLVCTDSDGRPRRIPAEIASMLRAILSSGSASGSSP
jgi:acyl-CoA thioester hydrolase